MEVFRFKIIGRASEAIYIFAKDIGSACALATYLFIENPVKYAIDTEQYTLCEGALDITESKVYFFGLSSVHPIDYIAALDLEYKEVSAIG